MSKNKSWYEIVNAGKTAEISIYDEIGYWGVTAKQFIKDLKGIKDATDITLRINSPGGSITDGNAIYNSVKALKCSVSVQIDSLAASMATVIALAGESVKMAENGFFMIHNPRGKAFGESKDLKKTADLMDKMKTNIINVYTSKTGKGDEEISEMMDDTTWMTAQEALDEGFIDEITDKIEIENNFDLSKLEKVPDALKVPSGNVAGIVNSTKEDVKMTKTVKKEDQPQDKPPVTDNVDVDAIEAKAREDIFAAEKIRKGEIEAVFKPFAKDHSDLMNKCMNDMDCDVQTARDNLLAELGKGEVPIAGTSSTVVIEDQSEKLVKGFTSAMSIRAGFEKNDSENEFRGYTLGELARLSLDKKGVSTKGMSKLDIVGAAFTHTTSDFSTALANTANKSMLKGYEEAEETFQSWTTQGSLSDFKTTSRIDLNTISALSVVPEGGEYHYGTVSDRGETVQLATYGKLFSITRQAIINDDLRVFTSIPQRMGRAAVRTVGNLVYAVLTGNPAMSDGTVLFHADHSNLAGTAGLPTTATFNAARVAMALQQDATGTTLNIRPQYVIVPVTQQGTALVVVNSETSITSTQQANSKVPNSVRGMVEVVADARLDASSTTAWYMAASPSMHDTIEVSYLDGNPAPTLEQQNGWNIDGVDFKVRLDAAVTPLDYVTMYKNAGA